MVGRGQAQLRLPTRGRIVRRGPSTRHDKIGDALKYLGRPITYYAPLKRAFGSTNAAVFVAQLLYWSGRGKVEHDGWLYKTVEEWEDETGLTYKEQMKCREVLKRHGVLEENYDRVSHRLYFRVSEERLAEVCADEAAAHDQRAGARRSPAVQRGDEHLTNGQVPDGQVAPAQRSGGTCPKGSSHLTKGQFDTSSTPYSRDDSRDESREGQGSQALALPSPNPMTLCIDRYRDLFARRYGAAPMIDQGDRQQLLRVLKHCGNDAGRVCGLLDRWFEDPDPWYAERGYRLALLSKATNGLLAAGGGKRRLMGAHPRTAGNEEVFRRFIGEE